MKNEAFFVDALQFKSLGSGFLEVVLKVVSPNAPQICLYLI